MQTLAVYFPYSWHLSSSVPSILYRLFQSNKYTLCFVHHGTQLSNFKFPWVKGCVCFELRTFIALTSARQSPKALANRSFVSTVWVLISKSLLLLAKLSIMRLTLITLPPSNAMRGLSLFQIQSSQGRGAIPHLAGARLKLELQGLILVCSPIISVLLRRLFLLFKASVFASVKWDSDTTYFGVALGDEIVLSPMCTYGNRPWFQKPFKNHQDEKVKAQLQSSLHIFMEEDKGIRWIQKK